MQQPKLILNQVQVYKIQRQSVDVEKWRKALQSAENISNPLRRQLYDIYHELMLDVHLYAMVSKRIRNIKNIKIRYVEEGKDTEDLNKDYFYAPWFTRMVELAMETPMWGHTLIEFDFKDGYINGVHRIPRHHVHPETGVVSLLSPYDKSGIKFRERPYVDFTLEVGLPDELGLLNIAAVNTILKRNGVVDYANFVEMFGSPIRHYEYDPMIENARAETEKAARESGNSAAIVTPKGYSELTLHHGTTSGNQDLHSTFLADLKKEVTILLLGQTMTTEDGSSRSQAEVHQDEQQQVINEDKLFISYLLNWELLPKLIRLGYPVSERGKFEFDEGETLTLKEQFDIDIKLLEKFHIPASYFAEKYGTPVEEKKEVAPIPPDPGTAKKAVPKKKSGCCDILTYPDALKSFTDYESVWRQLAKLIEQNPELLTDPALIELIYNDLIRALDQGFGQAQFGQPDPRLAESMKQNVAVFSGYKAAHQIEAAKQLLVDENGQPRSFSKFFQDVRKLNEQYNKHYLEAEYNLAVASAQMGAEWAYFEAEEDVYYLKYITAGDSRVRPAHAVMNGITLPASDPFWSIAYPPNDWNCRCAVTKVRRDREMASDSAKAYQIADKAMTRIGKDGKNALELFRQNPATSGQVFSEAHPYFEGWTAAEANNIRKASKR